MTEQTDLLLPPSDLMYRVAGTGDPDWFVRSGRQSVKDIESALQSVGRTLADFKSILDFGCGCGRIMLQLGSVVPLSSITGVEIDGEAIEWLRSRAPGATLVVVNGLPPTPLPDSHFDLVYCHSVFTHLDTGYQDAWLAELLAVCKPGAILVVSFAGEKPFQQLEQQWINGNADPAPMRKQLEEAGILFVTDDEWTGGPFPEFYHSSFHAVDYVKRHWGSYFKILNHIPGGSLGFQDFVVMERAPSVHQGAIPMPPPAFRALAGSMEDSYDSPPGTPIFPEVPQHLYTSVFDFGAGCGRRARQLLQQTVRPRRYLGVDLRREMVAWSQTHLSAIDPNFLFLHHKTYTKGLSPDNSPQPATPLPVGPGEFTFVNVDSVFTHVFQHQAEYYLREIERILKSGGIARTTWFFFDRTGYPWLDKRLNCVFVNPDDPTDAVVYEWRWFLDAVRAAGLSVRKTVFPAIAGHQWQVFLEKRRDGSTDQFPTAESAADWLCGVSPLYREHYVRLAEHLSELNRNLTSEIEALRRSWSWRLTLPLRKLTDLLTKH